MVRTQTDKWALLKDQFASLRQDETEQTAEAFFDAQIRRRFGEYITRAVLPEYKGRAVLSGHKPRVKR
jgi:hypothetical protein